MSDKPIIRISTSKDIKERFTTIAKKKKLNYGQLLSLLLDKFEENSNNTTITENSSHTSINEQSLKLSGTDLKEVRDAITNSDSSLLEIVQAGTLQRARYLNSVSKKESNFDALTDKELKEKSFKGIAKYRINQAVETIMNHNDLQGEKANKVCLTRGIIFKLTGSNRATINKFFDDYHVMISDHNQKHSLTDKDNRKGKNFSFEKLLGID